MKQLYSWILSVIVISNNIQINRADMKNIKSISNIRSSIALSGIQMKSHRNSDKKGYEYFDQSSMWSPWGLCKENVTLRQRHYLRRFMCGDSVEMAVVNYRRFRDRRRNLGDTSGHQLNDSTSREPQATHRSTLYIVRPADSQRHLEHSRERVVRARGFSSWSRWGGCARKCITTRQRHCRNPVLCGRKIIKQSAYCYFDGGYCQRWVRRKMQKRKDPELRAPDKIPEPVTSMETIIRAESQDADGAPKCGVVGRYSRRRRLHEMRRILGGRSAPPGKWPWQVVVLNKFKEAFCGGTLVSLRWVVTAAHCMRRRLFVRLGEHDLLMKGPGELEMRIRFAVVHPLYNPSTLVNDVALLKLPQPARPDLGHGIACLPTPEQPLPAQSNCVILGWGKMKPDDTYGSRILQEAEVSTVDQQLCRLTYWQYAITEDMVCAGHGMRDTCAGDSGGPLLRRHRALYYLQGITSFGDGCGKSSKFGIYTRTAGYVPWMKDIMATFAQDD